MGGECRKRRFPTAEQARERLSAIIAEGPQQLYTPINVVTCGKCDGYHLTSKTGKLWKHGKPRRQRGRTQR